MTTLFGPLQWADTTAVIIGYLAANLDGVVVTSKVQDPPVTPFVLVDRAGGIRDGIFEEARIALQVYGGTDEEAADTCNDCRDFLQRMPGVQQGFTVYQVTEFLGPTYAPDPESNPPAPRYLLTVEARFRANPKGT